MSRVREKSTIQDLSVAALSAELDFGGACKVGTIYFHFDAAVTETITITFVSAKGAAYTTVIQTQALSGETDFVFAPNGAIELNDGDKIKVQCTKATATATVGVVAKAEMLD